jgi:hypothetical protein
MIVAQEGNVTIATTPAELRAIADKLETALPPAGWAGKGVALGDWQPPAVHTEYASGLKVTFTISPLPA